MPIWRGKGGVGVIHEIRAVRRNGQEFDCEMTVSEVKYSFWSRRIFTIVMHDITERKEAQQAQERFSQQLHEKVNELETLSYAIAHDLKSPLVSIEGFSRLLRADCQNMDIEKVHEDIRIIESGVRKMRQLVNRTMEYSRAGKLVKPTENVPFGKIIEEVLQQFAEQLHSIGAAVSLADTFPVIYVDTVRIREVLTNLIQNSINYRDKTRPPEIEIGYWLSGGEFVFFVRDNGIGIEASETEKVFDLFYRGTGKGEGSGAGLAITKRIIEAHGGRVWAEGQSGKGTTICFTLPQQVGTNLKQSVGHLSSARQRRCHV
jgi:two-component system sensor kinase FixL